VGSRVELGSEDTHVVDFYLDDRALMARVADHLVPALDAHGTAVAVCTPVHRGLLVDAIADLAYDVERALEDGSLLLLDAADTLERFMRDGHPDPQAFDTTLGEVLRARSVPGRPFHVFGEMVALLWDEGKVTEAIELETLWNSFATQVRFDLYCAYRSELVGNDKVADQLDEICNLHSSVLGLPHADDVPEAVPKARRFAADVRSPALARSFVREVLAGFSPAVVDDVVTAASELAANAVVHGGSEFVVTIVQSAKGLRVAVADAGPGEPTLRPTGGLDSAGRGLQLVDSLATRWGIERDAAGKVVWAFFDLTVGSVH
jgi:anti-sigma regulatory factor (Ser/Thr protein kinase)